MAPVHHSYLPHVLHVGKDSVNCQRQGTMPWLQHSQVQPLWQVTYSILRPQISLAWRKSIPCTRQRHSTHQAFQLDPRFTAYTSHSQPASHFLSHLSWSDFYSQKQFKPSITAVLRLCLSVQLIMAMLMSRANQISLIQDPMVAKWVKWHWFHRLPSSHHLTVAQTFSKGIKNALCQDKGSPLPEWYHTPASGHCSVSPISAYVLGQQTVFFWQNSLALLFWIKHSISSTSCVDQAEPRSQAGRGPGDNLSSSWKQLHPTYPNTWSKPASAVRGRYTHLSWCRTFTDRYTMF